jgi:HEAT repeat protein
MTNPPPDRTRAAALSFCGVILAALVVNTGSAGAAWEHVAEFLSLQGKPAPASANVLSEHHLETLDSMPPQGQAEFLLERSINHYAGANEQIEARLGAWRGKIELTQRLNGLFMMAINSDDLRVRAAGIEVNILGRGLEKNLETLERLEPIARSGDQGPRANALWDLGLIGNRGVAPRRVAQILLASVHDDNVNVRYWAVEGLAYLGTDETIEPLLDIFRDDRSPVIRERAACSLAQSGMLSKEQRHRAVPRLLDYAGDYSLDDRTRGWVFQALRDITGQNLPRDPAAWRRWHDRQR